MGIENPNYRIGNVEIDARTRMIRRGSELVHLRVRSFDTLLYLIERRGNIVGKDELLQALWKDTSVSENVLAQSVREIREALADDPREPKFIRTIPKSGYCFIAILDEVAQRNLVPLEPLAARVSTFRMAAILVGLSLAAAAMTLNWNTLPAVPSDAEAAWWRLDEAGGVADSGRSHIGGTLAGSPHWTAGKTGRALSFDGLTTVIFGPDARALPLGNSPRSLTLWIQAPVVLVDDAGLFHYGSEDKTHLPHNFLFALTHRGKAAFGNGNYAGNIEGATSIADGRWHHLTGTWDGAMARIFVDGQLDAAGPLLKTPATGSGTGWSIGRFLLNGTPFRGAIGDVRVYSRVLKPSEVQAQYRCKSGEPDLRLKLNRSGIHYYMPIFYDAVLIDRASGELRNTGKDLAGVQFARSDGVCSAASLQGADVGQDADIRMELLVPADVEGHSTGAGPYFRSRKAGVGDGIIGGSSAGYLVQLDSSGMVKVRRLNPHAVVAFSAAISGFDSSVFHALEVRAEGETLRVQLDHRVVVFDQGGRMTAQAAIPAQWQRISPAGLNEGAAGIAFLTEDRGRIGGQRARNVEITFR